MLDSRDGIILLFHADSHSRGGCTLSGQEGVSNQVGQNILEVAIEDPKRHTLIWCYQARQRQVSQSCLFWYAIVSLNAVVRRADNLNLDVEISHLLTRVLVF